MPEIVGLKDVQRLVDEEGGQLLDVMSRESYDDSHLPNAINISLKELDANTATRLPRGRPVIAYCFDYQ